MKPAKKVLLIIGIVLGSIVLLVLAYFAYVFISFHRIEDNQTLSVTGSAKEEAVPVGTELTAVSYNIGYGAYSDDYTFFMDGGKESWLFPKRLCMKIWMGR